MLRKRRRRKPGATASSVDARIAARPFAGRSWSLSSTCCSIRSDRLIGFRARPRRCSRCYGNISYHSARSAGARFRTSSGESTNSRDYSWSAQSAQNWVIPQCRAAPLSPPSAPDRSTIFYCARFPPNVRQHPSAAICSSLRSADQADVVAVSLLRRRARKQCRQIALGEVVPETMIF